MALGPLTVIDGLADEHRADASLPFGGGFARRDIGGRLDMAGFAVEPEGLGEGEGLGGGVDCGRRLDFEVAAAPVGFRAPC